jgi:hypothetical protein
LEATARRRVRGVKSLSVTLALLVTFEPPVDLEEVDIGVTGREVAVMDAEREAPETEREAEDAEREAARKATDAEREVEDRESSSRMS